MSPEGGRNQFFLVGDVEKTVEVVCPLCGEQIDCLYHCVETDRWTRVRWGEEGPQEEEKPVVDEILGEVYICPNCVSELFTDGDAAVAFLRGEELDRLIDVRLIPRPDTEPFPPFETIKRLRQKIQHIERSHLPTDPRVRRKRGISDEEYQHWIARSKRRGRGAKK